MGRPMHTYHGSCHCGAISYIAKAPEIIKGLRCNCSICRRKGALMTEFTVPPENFKVHVEGDALSTYQFGSKVAKHNFCKNCGIYTHHETRVNPGHYRLNIGCIEGIDVNSLPSEVHDGASK